jgi:hypothetical protein
MDVTEESTFSVDVVDLERSPEHVRARVLEKGRVLYERER